MLKTSSLSNINYIRDAFDQVLLIVGSSAFFTQKPLIPSEIRKCLGSPHHRHWISGLFAQYDKNDPTIVSLFPSQSSISPLRIKSCVLPCHQIENLMEKTFGNFILFNFSDEITQIRGSEFTESLFPLIITCLVNYIIYFASSRNIIGEVLVITNTFQNIIIAPVDRVYVTTTPYYLQWFCQRYPKIKIKYSNWVRHALQACN